MSYSVVYHFKVSFSSLITSVGDFCFRLLVLLCSSSSGCLGKVALFYCGTLWAFHITILKSGQLHELTNDRNSIFSQPKGFFDTPFITFLEGHQIGRPLVWDTQNDFCLPTVFYPALLLKSL